MNDIQILRQNPRKVLESLKSGEVERMELSVEQITDEFMIYGLRGGLIDELANSFPDPREECEITAKEILSASIAGRFQDMYALSQSPYALHSPILLAELGLNVKVLCEGEGISRRGTQENIPFTGDVIRKLLYGITDPFILVEWYNRIAGAAYLRQASYEPCIHILDCTELEVVLENENYEGSGIVSRKREVNGVEVEERTRGYKLGSLRSLLDDGGVITAIAFGAIQVHDLKLCKKLIMTTPHLKPGDILIEDRGFLDGKTVSRLKEKRGVDTILPLRSNMQAYNDAIVSAYHHADTPWEQHPSRERQEIKKIEYVDYLWDECSVPLIGCVVREPKECRDGGNGREDYKHWVFVTTRLTLTGRRMIQTYELRPEIEEDHRQWKEGLWDMTKFTSTSLVQVIYHVICVLLAYNLCQVYSNTRSGQRFAQTTLRRLRRQQIRNHDASMVVYAGNSYAIFGVKFLFWLLLDQPKDIQERLKPHFMSGFT
jgi:hypothetical protein